MKNKNEERNEKKEQLEVEKGSDNEIKGKLPAPDLRRKISTPVEGRFSF